MKTRKVRKAKLLSFLSLLILGITLLSHISVKAQTPPLIDSGLCSLAPIEQIIKSEPVLKSDKSAKPVATSSRTLKVNQPIALRLSNISMAGGDLNSVSLGDRIRVTINGLSTAINRGFISVFDQVRQTTSLQPFDFQSLVLQLNGYALNGIQGTYVSPNQMEFQLTHFEDSHRAWTSIFGNALHPTRQVTVNIGCPNGEAIALDPEAQAKNRQFNQITIHLWQSLRGSIIFIPILVLMITVWISLKGSILRDVGVTHNRTFSLSRTQLAWWSYLVFFSFLVLFSITGDYTNIVTSQAMILLGLGAATTVGATVIDTSSDRKLSQEQETLLCQLDRELLHIKAELKQESQGSHDWKNLMDAKEALEQRINQYELQSKGFFRDLLMGSNGEVNLHRYQILIWTIVLGLIFIYEVLVSFKMPEFDTTLLTLQGISSGTYLTLKAQGESEAKSIQMDSPQQKYSVERFRNQFVTEVNPGQLPDDYLNPNPARASNPDPFFNQPANQRFSPPSGSDDITEITRRVLDPDQ